MTENKEQKLFLQNIDSDFNDIFNTEKKFTFLVGAGISIPKPTGLHSAKYMMNYFLSLLIPKNEIDKIIDKVRFEQVISLVEEYIDHDLSFLKEFDKRAPNLLHYFLAGAILKGHHVITTNFDCMIEKALSQIKTNKIPIKPIINKEDFLHFSESDIQLKNNFYAIYKIHGSKINYITGEDTSSSLVTTMNQLGQEGIDKTFSIAPFKRKVFRSLIKKRTLIVMGYSGGDSFDIMPELSEMIELENIHWLHFNPNNKITDTLPKEITLDKNYRNQLFKIETLTAPFYELLYNSKRLNKNLTIHFNEGNIIEFVQFFLFEKLTSKSIVDINKLIQNDSDSFSFNLSPINNVKQCDVICRIYTDLGENNLVKEWAKKGLNLATNNLEKSQFLIHLGFIARHEKKFYEADNYHQQALEVEESPNKKALIYNELGRNQEHQDNFLEAQNYYKLALAEVDENNYQKEKITYLNNIATTHALLGNHDIALVEYQDILKQAVQQNDSSTITWATFNIAVTYFNLKEWEKGIQKCKEAIRHATHIGDYFLKTRIMNMLASMYDQTGQYGKAIDIFSDNIKIYELLNHLPGKAESYSNIGAIYFSKNEFYKAIENYKKSCGVYRYLENHSKVAELNHHIAGIFFKQKDWSNAMKHELIALNTAQKYNLPEQEKYEFFLQKIQASIPSFTRPSQKNERQSGWKFISLEQIYILLALIAIGVSVLLLLPFLHFVSFFVAGGILFRISKSRRVTDPILGIENIILSPKQFQEWVEEVTTNIRYKREFEYFIKRNGYPSNLAAAQRKAIAHASAPVLIFIIVGLVGFFFYWKFENFSTKIEISIFISVFIGISWGYACGLFYRFLECRKWKKIDGF